MGTGKAWGICSNCKHRIGCFTFYDYRDTSRPGWDCATPGINTSFLTIIDSQTHPNRILGNDSNIIVEKTKDAN